MVVHSTAISEARMPVTPRFNTPAKIEANFPWPDPAARLNRWMIDLSPVRQTQLKA